MSRPPSPNAALFASLATRRTGPAELSQHALRDPGQLLRARLTAAPATTRKDRAVAQKRPHAIAVDRVELLLFRSHTKRLFERIVRRRGCFRCGRFDHFDRFDRFDQDVKTGVTDGA